jgi:ribonuclease E
MLINGQHAEEVRVAVIEGEKDKWELSAYRVAVADSRVERGNIYRGVVANVEPSLDAAFIDFGAGRHGFLTRHDVFEAACGADGKAGAAIDEVLQRGQPILVQVTRDAAGQKGATLTTNISLAGRYMVLMPFEDQRGVSRKVEDEELRRKLREKVKNLVAGDFGFIVRTNAADQTKTELKADLDQLKRLWKQVLDDSKQGKRPRLLHDDQDVVIQVLRDYLDARVDEVLVDDEQLLARAERYLSAAMPRRKVTLSHHDERLPLFSRYNLEPKIAAIYRRDVPLRGGGALVIDPTEALTAVDVNSGKSKGGDSQKDTAYHTNLEAAEEVARQLRLRDIGGLVVVDFIDMRPRKHQQAVEKALKEAMKPDRARHQVGRLSRNGLLEINRQRIGQALHVQTHVPCPTCSGVGHLVNPDLVALGLLRRLEARAATGWLQQARIALNPQVANAVQNRRRAQLAALEAEFHIDIEITGQPGLEISEERIEWINRDAPAQVPQRTEGGAGAGSAAPGTPRQNGAPSRPPLSSSTTQENELEGDSKRRRRRRSRRKKPAREAEAQAAESPAKAEQEAAKPEAGKRSKRKRRGRKKKTAKETQQEAPAQPQPADEPAKETGRRRPRRRRRKAAKKSAE